VTPYRCSACGNKTRFDVLESKRVRSFLHFTLGGELTVEEEEVLERAVESVTCRWCGSSSAVESVEPRGSESAADEPTAAQSLGIEIAAGAQPDPEAGA
jgi:hypothetical protein